MSFGKRFLAMLMIIVLLPYVFTVFFAGDKASGSAFADSQEKLQVQVGERLYSITEEEYLLSAMAAAVPADYEPETMKAVAVILRTNLYRMLQQAEAILVDEDAFVDEADRLRVWGIDAYLQYQKEGRQAIQAVKGLLLKSEGELIDAAFHGISAGTTRQGAYPYLQAVESSQDRFAPRYIHTAVYSAEELSRLFPGISREQWEQISFTAETDSSYIKEVCAGDTVIGGEEFRETLSLRSSAFFGSWEEEKLRIVCRGLGHGYGFSCYGANELAKEGKTFEELLACYYGNISVEGE